LKYFDFRSTSYGKIALFYFSVSPSNKPLKLPPISTPDFVNDFTFYVETKAGKFVAARSFTPTSAEKIRWVPLAITLSDEAISSDS